MLNAKRQALVEKHLKVAVAIAKRVSQSANLPPSIRFDDLISFGHMGLVDAANKFSFKRGIGFGSFAAKRIEGAIYDGVRGTNYVSKHFRQQASSGRIDKIYIHKDRLPYVAENFLSEGKTPFEAASLGEQMKTVLSSVPMQYRDVFERYFLRGESMFDIGRRLGKSESCISQRIRAVIFEVRKRLAPWMLREKAPRALYNRRLRRRA